MTISPSIQVSSVVPQLVSAMTVIMTMSVLVTGLSAGLLASGVLGASEPAKKSGGITFGAPKKPPKK